MCLFFCFSFSFRGSMRRKDRKTKRVCIFKRKSLYLWWISPGNQFHRVLPAGSGVGGSWSGWASPLCLPILVPLPSQAPLPWFWATFSTVFPSSVLLLPLRRRLWLVFQKFSYPHDVFQLWFPFTTNLGTLLIIRKFRPCTFSYSVKCMCNPQINTQGSGGHLGMGTSRAKSESPHTHVPSTLLRVSALRLWTSFSLLSI